MKVINGSCIKEKEGKKKEKKEGVSEENTSH